MISTWRPEAESMREMPGKMKESMSCSATQLQEAIEQNPGAAVLISMGIGFGIGLMLAGAMKQSSAQAMSQDNFAQRLGHRVMDSFRDVVPSQWMDRIPSAKQASSKWSNMMKW